MAVKSTASLVCAIVGFCCCGPILGVVAIILGILGRKDEGPNGSNAAGIVLGVIAVVAWIIALVVLWLLSFACVGGICPI